MSKSSDNKFSIIDIEAKGQDDKPSFSKNYKKYLQKDCENKHQYQEALSNPAPNLEDLLTMGAFCQIYRRDDEAQTIADSIRMKIKGHIEGDQEITQEDVNQFRETINNCEALGSPVDEKQIKSEGDRIMGAGKNTNLSEAKKIRKLFSCSISQEKGETQAVLTEIASKPSGPRRQ